MTEAYWARYESTIDRQIREATARGAFDDLPGKGEPLRGLDGPDDENWWIRSYVQREGLDADALLPESLLLRKQVQRLPGVVGGLRTETEVRERVSQLNRSIAAWMRTPSPPLVALAPVDVDEVVARWRTGRADAGAPSDFASTSRAAGSEEARSEGTRSAESRSAAQMDPPTGQRTAPRRRWWRPRRSSR